METGRRNTKSGKRRECLESARKERRMYQQEKLREELSNTLTQVAPLVSTVSLEAEGSME